MNFPRRTLLQSGGLALLAYGMGSSLAGVAPATAGPVPFHVLTPNQAAALNRLGELLVPGALRAGLAHFVDRQLAAPLEQNMLMLRYLGVAPPFTGFYRGALDALDQLCEKRYRTPFAQLPPDRAEAVIAAIAQENPPDWSGPPAPLSYFVIRSDAVDVVYGTRDGFAALDIPYMAHIAPPAPAWS